MKSEPKAPPPTHPSLTLPVSIVDTRDIRACLQALDQVDDQLIDQVVRVRAKLTSQITDVRLPPIVQDILSANKRTLSSQRDVEQLRKELEKLAVQAPRLRLHFASEPDERLRLRLVNWLRANIHPALVVEMPVRAGLAGGFVIETPRRHLDFSWKTQFNLRQARIIELLRAKDPTHGA